MPIPLPLNRDDAQHVERLMGTTGVRNAAATPSATPARPPTRATWGRGGVSGSIRQVSDPVGPAVHSITRRLAVGARKEWRKGRHRWKAKGRGRERKVDCVERRENAGTRITAERKTSWIVD